MAKKKKRKLKAKNFQKIRDTEPLLKSNDAVANDVKPVDKEIYNRADSTLNNLVKNVGMPRQKVRMK